MPFGIDIGNYIAEVTTFLEDADYPADKEELIEHARDSGAPDEVISGLDRIPDGIYERVEDVVEVVSQQEQGLTGQI